MKTSKTFPLRPVARIFLLLLCFFAFGAGVAKEVCVVDAPSLNLRESPSARSAVVRELKKGNRLDLISEQNGWAQVRFRGDTCYVSAAHVLLSTRGETEAVPDWVSFEEDYDQWAPMYRFFSTDRIMEALPDFGLLRGRLPVDPDVWFNIAFALLLITGVTFPVLGHRTRYGNLWYWGAYLLTMVISVSECLYLLSSPDPLGFCDINNEWFGTALFYLLLCGLGLYQQLRLFSTVLFATQHDADFDFKAGWAVKLLMLVVLFFIASIVAYHFGTELPAWAGRSVAAALLLPVVFMLYRAVRERDFLPLLLLLPFYVVAGAGLLAVYCVIGTVVALLALIWGIICLMGGDSEMFVKKDGVWYWCDYDTWQEGFDGGVWDDWSSTFHSWMVK